MDPFSEVQEDCWAQICALEKFVGQNSYSPDAELDFRNDYQELSETLEDLKQAVHISEANPAHFRLSLGDIAQRKQILAQLQARTADLQKKWGARPQLREVTLMLNRISHEGSSPVADPFTDPPADGERIDAEFSAFQEQQMIQNQDLQLDSIHETMRNLNQQAQLMGLELEDQGFMLDDLDNEMDLVGNKVLRGLRRVNYVIEKNRETASNWCIGILMVVLCVLLVVLLVA